jgi:hypothetical protein
MRSTSSFSVAFIAALGLIGLSAGASGADTLDADCQALDRTAETRCRLSRTDAEAWVLETGYRIGTGRKAGIEIFETRFCDAAKRAGRTARVLRSSEIPDVLGKGAVMEFQCGMPSVAAAPRTR